MKDRFKGNELMDSLRVIAPGTLLREGLENILKAKTGALIVVGDTPEVLSLVDGGFHINKDYSPSNIYELAKMDGAIILSRDAKKILIANALLIPDSTIPTNETGTRHKTAERFAKQTGEIVVSISERRNVITLYKGNHKYALKDTSRILARANQALQTLEKYKAVLDNSMANLSVLEFEDMVTLSDVSVAVQRTEMVMRIALEIEKDIYELGNEGVLVSMQLDELVGYAEEEGQLVLEDYILPTDNRTVEDIFAQLRNCSQEELLDLNYICKILGYSNFSNPLDLSVYPKGYRILNKIPRVPMLIIQNLVQTFENFQGILGASIEELDDVDGIGEVRAKAIKEGLRRSQDQLIMDIKRI